MRSVSMLRPFASLVAAILAQVMTLPAGYAATATSSLLVSATVLSTCTVVTTPIVFGNYTTIQIDTTGSVTVTCTLDVASYNIGLGTGVGASSTTATRKMTAPGGGTLNYAMFSDASRTVNWGEIPGTDTIASTANTSGVGAVKTFTAYARVPAGQTSAAAVYTDAVLVTVNF